MTASPAGSPMSVLGFSAVEEHLYRVVLRHPGASVDVVSEMSGVSGSRLRDALARFAASGLLRVDGDVLVPQSPDQALGRLISDETRRLQSVHEQLESLRSLLPSLMADHLASSQTPRGEQVRVEVVEGGDIADLIRSISATSTGELLWLRPDQWRYRGGREIDDWVVDLVRGGRKSRAIYPSRVLEEAPDVVRARSAAGEQVRVLADVPCRLAIMGSSAALMPEEWGVNTGRRLVLRQGGLLGALTTLFDALWERGMPVPGLDGSADVTRQGERQLLLDQLAAGAKDEQIARALGLSLRTVRRRVADLLDELGVGSRFQAGVEAVRRGWM